MKTVSMSLLAGAASALVSLVPISLSHAQAMVGDRVDTTATLSGNWTLKQRENWLDNRLDKARDDGSIDRHEYDRVREELSSIKDDEDQFRGAHDGQLTDNENNTLEARLDSVADQIHWLHESSFQKPW